MKCVWPIAANHTRKRGKPVERKEHKRKQDGKQEKIGKTRGGWQRGLEPSLHDRPS